ncbi:MFS transporter [Lewinella cohaerens]|uniref:MFS transporter n=1 Tax=Lewinella cohaerens TaxID=70995 RepID=UPI0003797D8E|nr:MFS transporter [Lewinella cohaerens]
MLPIQKRLSNFFYGILSLPSTALGFALSVQISALSWLLSTKYELAIDEIGLVWAAGPIAGIFGQIIFGVLSDRVWFWGGRRRPFIVIGGILAALSLLALPNLEIISSSLGLEGILGVAIAVALALDLSINVGFNPTRSIIADVTPEGAERTKGFTYMQTISGTFGMMAYVIGAVLDKYWLIYIGAGLVLLFTVIPPFFIEEPRDFEEEADEEKESGGWLESLMAIRPLWGFLIYALYRIPVRIFEWEINNYYVEYLCVGLTAFLIIQTLLQKEEGKPLAVASRIGFQKVLAAHSFTWIGVQTMFIYMFAFLQYRLPDLDNDGVGRVIDISFLVLNGIAALLPAFLLEPLTRRIGRVRTHLICVGIMTIGYLGLWLIGTSANMIYLLMVVIGIGWAATISLVFAIMSQKVEAKKMGLYMGLFNLSVVLPQLVASLGIGEFLKEADDKSLTFLICAVCLGVSTLAWSLVKENEEEVSIR